MKLTDFLQGKWLGHPLHPAIVHLPIGLWLAVAVADLVALANAEWSGTLARFSHAAVLIALVTALLAVPPGVADWSSIKKEKPAWKIGLWHMALNLVAVLIWAANFGLRAGRLDDPAPITGAIAATSVVGALMVGVSGYLGCLMVFDQGVSVARASKNKWRRIAQRGGARLPEK